MNRDDFVKWGRKGGKVTSEAKTEAARRNSRKPRARKAKVAVK
jgi:hypothetical protein